MKEQPKSRERLKILKEIQKTIGSSEPPKPDTHNCRECGTPLIQKSNCVIDETEPLLCHACWKKNNAKWELEEDKILQLTDPAMMREIIAQQAKNISYWRREFYKTQLVSGEAKTPDRVCGQNCNCINDQQCPFNSKGQLKELTGSVPTPSDESRKYLETSLKTFMMIRDLKIPGMDLETPISKLEAFLLRSSTGENFGNSGNKG